MIRLVVAGLLAMLTAAPGSALEALTDAVMKGDAKTVDRLLKAGTPADSRGERGATALMLAAQGDRIAIAVRLIAAGADVNAVRPGGTSALFPAAATGSSEMVRLLVTNGARLDALTDSKAVTPLLSALRFRNWANAETLLDLGANIASQASLTPFGAALAPSDATFLVPEMPVRLVERLKAVDAAMKMPTGGPSALHLAAEQLQPHALAAAISAGGDVNAQDDKGRTPLLLATAAARFESLLVGAALLATANSGGMKALMASMGNAPALAAARTRFATVGMTTMSAAAVKAELAETDRRRLAVIGLLLKAGADPRIADKSGKTVAENVAYLGDPAITEAMTRGGSQP